MREVAQKNREVGFCLGLREKGDLEFGSVIFSPCASFCMCGGGGEVSGQSSLLPASFSCGQWWPLEAGSSAHQGCLYEWSGKAADSAGGKALRSPGLDRKCLGRKWLLRASLLWTAGRGVVLGRMHPVWLRDSLTWLLSALWVGGRGWGVLCGDQKG